MARIKWNFEKAKEVAAKYGSRSAFEKGDLPAYAYALKNKIMDDICDHMVSLWKKKWDFDSIKTEALKYETRFEFQSKSPAYQAARSRNIVDEVCQHMESKYNTWNNESIAAEALKYKTRKEFRSNSPAYRAAEKRKILDQVCQHMSDTGNKWTVDSVRSVALNCKTRMEFQKIAGAYDLAQRRGILDDVCKHMTPMTNTSSLEKSLFSTIKKEYPKAQKFVDRRVFIAGKPHIKGFDIDIYIPELRKGIEFDGTYYHSIAGLKRGRPHWPDDDLENYHEIKDTYFKSKGIEILHIGEKDWLMCPELQIKKCNDFLKKTGE